MKEIEEHLRKIKKTDDLNYSKQDVTINEAMKAEVDEKVLIDPDMLERLIDECREEEEKL